MYPNNQQYPQNIPPRQDPPYQPPQPQYQQPQQQQYPQTQQPQQQYSAPQPQYQATPQTQQQYNVPQQQDFSQPQYSVDYLNQIAGPQPTQEIGMKAKILLWGGIGLVVLIAIALFGSMLSSGGTSTVKVDGLSANLAATQEVVTDAQSKLKSSKLRTTNSQLNIFITQTQQRLNPFLVAAGYKDGEIPEEVTETAKDQKMIDKLEEGRLNGTFDRTYINEMVYKLELLSIMIQQTIKSTDGAEAKKELTSILEEMTKIKDEFSKLSSADL